jgi:rsbT co-antagonist protein RsbR
MSETRLPAILSRYRNEIIQEWTKEQLSGSGQRAGLMNEAELREQCGEFLDQLIRATSVQQNVTDTSAREYTPVRDLLSRISRSRGEQGFTPSDTAMFIFSLKRPLFNRIRSELSKDPDALFGEIWTASQLLDRLGVFTMQAYQEGREAVINRQQVEMLELSTPVVKLWDGVLALPLIGTLDSQRTQTVMENLLQRVVETNSEVVIIDITGVPTVDTLVAQHLLKTVSAARFMGVECIISGIRPQIAQTIVHLGVTMGDVITKATLADAFKVALGKRGMRVTNGVHNAAAPVTQPQAAGNSPTGS